MKRTAEIGRMEHKIVKIMFLNLDKYRGKIKLGDDGGWGFKSQIRICEFFFVFNFCGELRKCRLRITPILEIAWRLYSMSSLI